MTKPSKPTLREAAEMAVDVLERLGYDPVDLREALAEPQITTPDVCGKVCARAKLCYGCGKALDEANASWMSHEELKAYWSGYGNGKQEALAEQVHTPYCKQAPMCKTPCGNSDCVEQAEQEPVAWWFQPPNKNVRPMFDTQQHGGKWKPLYAAPVQQVDLTDDEIADKVSQYGLSDYVFQAMDMCRAVIAADREKNK